MTCKSFIAHKNNLSLKLDSTIFLVGLSHKANKTWEVLEAFCDSTNSWKIINTLIKRCKNTTIFKSNLVKWVPIDESNKIRYPSNDEKLQGLSRLVREINIFKPKKVCLFGKHVSDFAIKNLKTTKLSDNEYLYNETIFVLADHPSYIAVYRRKFVDEYVNNLATLLLSES